MASYILKTFNHSAPPQNVTTNLFTVPAGHIYMIKNAVVNQVNNSAAAKTFRLEKSDNAGANFRTVTPELTIPATNGNIGNFNLCKGASASVQNSTLGSSAPDNELDNMVFEAGSILRIVNPNTITTAVEIGGIDYTI